VDRIQLLERWLESISAPDWAWFAKRLSANDTGATGSHQAGLYLPTGFAFEVAPALRDSSLNPRVEIRLALVSHNTAGHPSLIYYNNRIVADGSRDECRFTGFGGRKSPLQDPESTGALLLLAFNRRANVAEGWLAAASAAASTIGEEEAIEGLIGAVTPGTLTLRVPDQFGQMTIEQVTAGPAACDLDLTTLPSAWFETFPSPLEISAETARRAATAGLDPDGRLVRRVTCEFELFKAIEEIHARPMLKAGFASLDEFLTAAQSLTQRRKSRAGRSLELQMARIFDEEAVSYTSHGVTESGRLPDFVFPSIEAYRHPRVDRPVHMLAVKTSLRDRWRQVLDEAALLPTKHLLTMAEGVSELQFRQITEGGLVLVVPHPNIARFPAAVRSSLLDVASFVRLVRT
jgi:hypothetical protein